MNPAKEDLLERIRAAGRRLLGDGPNPFEGIKDAIPRAYLEPPVCQAQPERSSNRRSPRSRRSSAGSGTSASTSESGDSDGEPDPVQILIGLVRELSAKVDRLTADVADIKADHEIRSRALITKAEAASIARRSKRSIENWIKQKKLRPHRTAGKTLVERAQLEALLRGPSDSVEVSQQAEAVAAKLWGPGACA